MSRKRIFYLVLLFFIVFADLHMLHRLEEGRGRYRQSQLHDTETSLATLRAFAFDAADYKTICNFDAPKRETEEYMLACIFCRSAEKKRLEQWCVTERQAEPERYEAYCRIVKQLLTETDAVYFPVPASVNNPQAAVSYENSWQYERTYGGNRGHEGTDIMASIQQRGYYPVVSASEGTVEKIGWLPKGGYRIGVRSPNGVYYYYAHLAEYEDGITEGTALAAGQLIGYMGDTGYSEVEGTTGNFPVHLHFGMYLNDAQGVEVSFNPYSLLQLLEENRLKYVYQKSS